MICIPLLKELGYAYAKYVDLTKLDDSITQPEILKVYDCRTDGEIERLEDLIQFSYLLSPILVAGLRPTLKKNLWRNVGSLPLTKDDETVPDFKSGCSTYEEIEKGDWFIHRKGQLNKTKTNYSEVKYLQPFTAMGTGTIEIRLTMHFLIASHKNVQDFFDLEDERYKANYIQVLYSPSLRNLA